MLATCGPQDTTGYVATLILVPALGASHFALMGAPKMALVM